IEEFMAKPNGATAERVTVVGAGYVGLVTAASLADLGHHVISMDIDSERIGRLQDGDIPIYEPGLAELVEKNRPRLTFTDNPTVAYADSEFIYICVDTPPTHSGDADLSRVWNVVDNLPPQDGERILVIKSTVPVGTGAVIRNELNRRGYEHIHYSSNPEFLREGTALQDFMRPDRIVIGADDPTVARKVASLYDAIETELVLTNVASAEMIKYASNAFLATKISFINEIANVCEATGADVTTVAHGMGLDPRIGPGGLAHVGNLVDEADLGGQEGVGGVLDHLRGGHVGEHQLRFNGVVQGCHLPGHRGVVRPHHYAVRPHEVLEGRALPQELGVGRVVNVLVTAPVQLIADDRPGAHGHGGLGDQSALPILGGQVIHHVPHP